MSCTRCSRVFGNKCIESCKCGECNMCHFGHTCMNGKTWWSEKGDPEKQSPFVPGQSHGGGSFPIISCSCKRCFMPRASSICNGKLKIYSHCGNTCRNNKCSH